MAQRPKHAVLIGLDGANYESMKPLCERGLLPNLTRLFKESTYCPNTFSYPTLTGAIWPSIATGAWPGTHGATDMSYHVAGEPLDHWYSSFTSDAVEAETLWEALARVGKKSIVLKYTGSWPPRHPDLVMVDGGGGRPFWGGSILEISRSQLVSTEAMPNAGRVQTVPASGWASCPESMRPPLEFALDYRPLTGSVPDFLRFKEETIRTGESMKLHGLIHARGADYDTLILCQDKRSGEPWLTLTGGQWSGPLEYPFVIDGTVRRGTFRMRLDWLDGHTGAFALYFTQVYPIDGFTQPRELGEELVRKFGAYANHAGYSAHGMGWFRDGPNTVLQFIDDYHEWLGGAGAHLMTTRPWDLFAIQSHGIDWCNHMFVRQPGWSQEQVDAGLAHIARGYQSVDRLVGRILEAAGDEALVCVVSDHGATSCPIREVCVNDILHDAGLLAYEQDPTDSTYLPGHGERPFVAKVDQPRTIAQQQRSPYIYLNVQGRDPGGVVPADQYQQTRDRVIEALYAYRDPETGRNPFTLVVRKEDARCLGLYDCVGRDVGDIVYALLPQFDHEHGRQLPSAKLEGHAVTPLLLFHGPGIKRGAEVGRTANLIDIAPTMAHAMQWPVPTEADGAVLYQIFADHTTRFPRPEFLEAQERRMQKIRRSAGEATTVTHVTATDERLPAMAPVPSDETEPMPQSVEALQAALLQARGEAAQWKSTYEHYYRITHGN